MISEFHFLRPWWLCGILPLLFFSYYWLKQPYQLRAWTEICDKHLFSTLLQFSASQRSLTPLTLIISVLSMIIALSGPSWSRLPVPTYKQLQPYVFILDMSHTMLTKDLSPNRLSRAKFKLHDILRQQRMGQFGLIVYTGEPFIVAPLTDDTQTIDALINSLTTDIMPVDGQRLDLALEQAHQLIEQAGFKQGHILIFTSEPPGSAAIAEAKHLTAKNIFTSLMWIQSDKKAEPLAQHLVRAGQGKLLFIDDPANNIEQWFDFTNQHSKFIRNQNISMPTWRDEGRWFLVPALLFLLPVFRRNWLQEFSI